MDSRLGYPSYYQPVPADFVFFKGELQSKTILKGVKDGDKTKKSHSFILIFVFSVKRYKPPNQKPCTPCSQFLGEKGRSLFVVVEGKGTALFVDVEGKEQDCLQMFREKDENLVSSFSLSIYKQSCSFPSTSTNKVVPFPCRSTNKLLPFSLLELRTRSTRFLKMQVQMLISFNQTIFIKY